MSPLTITLKVTRKPTFVMEDFDGINFASAVESAIGGFCNGDWTPDTDDVLQVEACEVEVNGRRIWLSYDVDWRGPVDGRGMRQWKCSAYEGAKRLAEGFGVGNVIADAVRAIEAAS